MPQVTDATDDGINFGFDVTASLSLTEWLDASADGAGEYIHLFPDAEGHRLVLFRESAQPGDSEWVRTEIGPVLCTGGTKADTLPRSYYLTGGDADNLLGFLRLYVQDRQHISNRQMTHRYYADAVPEKYDGVPVQEESMYLSYRTDSGREQRLMIHAPYRTDDALKAKAGRISRYKDD